MSEKMLFYTYSEKKCFVEIFFTYTEEADHLIMLSEKAVVEILNTSLSTGAFQT